VAAKWITNALHNCTVATSPIESHVNAMCAMTFLDSTNLVGTTGRVLFNEVTHNRAGSFSIFNIVNGSAVRIGGIERSRTAVLGAIFTADIAGVVWSDGVTNRTEVPQWGQVPATPSPTPQPFLEVRAEDRTSSDLGFGETTSIVLGVCILAAAAVVLWHRDSARRKRFRPCDFRKIIEFLQKESDPFPRKVVSKSSATPAPDAPRGGVGPEIAVSIERLPANSQDLSVPQELARRDVILGDSLGKGQYGEVQRGQLSTLVGRVRTSVAVAVKMAQIARIDVIPNLSSEPNDLLFLAECAVTWQFAHENVVQMYGVVTAGAPCVLQPSTHPVVPLAHASLFLCSHWSYFPSHPCIFKWSLPHSGTCWFSSCAIMGHCTTGSGQRQRRRLILACCSGSSRTLPQAWPISHRASLSTAIWLLAMFCSTLKWSPKCKCSILITKLVTCSPCWGVRLCQRVERLRSKCSLYQRYAVGPVLVEATSDLVG
jgi:hypothetical protein